MVRIGGREIGTNIFLAPLSDVSDLAFRLIAREMGAKFCFFEMNESNSLVHGSPRSKRILRTCPEDQPIAAHLLGTDPGTMLKAAEIVLDQARIAFLDINAACPARKVYNNGAGACFMNDPAALVRVIEHLGRTLPVPITVKMRVGLDRADIPGSVRFARACESAGAAALFVHGRCRTQENHGAVDYEAIRSVKESAGIPVFGSGNILNPPLAKKMFDETGCDGILVAKGSFGNPFIYRDIETYLETGFTRPAVGLREKLELLKKHLRLVREIEGPGANGRVGKLAKICLWYLKGFPEASRMRAGIYQSKNDQELFQSIEALAERC